MIKYTKGLHNCIFTFSLLLMLSALSCTFDKEEEILGLTNCGLKDTGFHEHVFPVIQTNCAVPACHVAGAQQPNLSQHSGIANSAQLIKIRINNGTMPPASSGKSLTQDEIKDITCWIDQGSQKN